MRTSLLKAFRTALRRRPVSSLCFFGATGAVSSAHFIEYRANDQERKHRLDESVPAHILPREYDWDALNLYWGNRPVTATKRLVDIAVAFAPFVGACLKDYVFQTAHPGEAAEIHIERAAMLREILTDLGPAFVKAGQQLSIRPDLVPTAVLKELQKLCDSVRPVPDEVAFCVIKEELGIGNLDEVFKGMHLVASASIGQVYKAELCGSGNTVAVKVQRPEMRRQFSLDLFLLQQIGVLVDACTSLCTNQPPFHKALYESFSRGSYMELDYENEAENQLRFRNELLARNCPVVVPQVHIDLTTERVLTSEWIEGVKLADSPKEKIRELIPVGVELFLTQLLDMGEFHSDPHAGNLLVTEEGKLCLLDFGLCANVDKQSRDALTKALYHLLVRDFDTLIKNDAKELGFLPEDYDTTEIKPLVTKILTVGLVEASSNLHIRKRKLMEISNELNDIFFKYPFSVPPFFALITRALGLLEGIALTGDPDFDIFQASAPYARRQAIKLLGAHALYRNRPTVV